MTLLSISLLIFGISILFFTILMIIWWKKYGKPLFSILKDLNNTQNPTNFMENIGNLGNLEDFYKNMGNFGGQMGNFNQRMNEIAKKMTKK
jgi:type II secretory pathway component PulF